MVNETIAVYSRLDYACNNAGILGAAGLIAECSEENWDRVMDAPTLKGLRKTYKE